ncbi:MAG: hypothetical protein DMG68_01975 [Acidobacteria bacterium]|nr:MAG: hypothetical protein DMG68_01975 [Acidobacteriota bacterium]
MDVFHLFPNVSAAVLVGCDEIDCGKIAKAIKTATEKVPVVLLHTRIGATCRDADHDLSSAEPEKLLELCGRCWAIPAITQAPRCLADAV